MKFCTFLWKKTATQKIFCIAVMQKCIANCDAIPGKLFPGYALKEMILGRKMCLEDLRLLMIFPQLMQYYHKLCMMNFKTKNLIPMVYSVSTSTSKTAKTGRTKHEVKLTAFLKVVKSFEENDEEQTTVVDFVTKMQEYFLDTDHDADSIHEEKIQWHFAERIV